MHQHTGSLSLSLLAIALFAGCGNTGPVRAPIQGNVTVAGQPLAAGRILFTPVAPNQGPATSAVITAGEYKIPKGEGPIVGKNRVEVEADLNLGFAIDDEAAFAKRGGKPLPPNAIPPQFNRESQLVVEVKAGEDNSYDIAVPQARHAAARANY
jgi:hypothetical protein